MYFWPKAKHLSIRPVSTSQVWVHWGKQGSIPIPPALEVDVLFSYYSGLWANCNNTNNKLHWKAQFEIFTISSLRRELSPTHTLKQPGCNCVQITYFIYWLKLLTDEGQLVRNLSSLPMGSVWFHLLDQHTVIAWLFQCFISLMVIGKIYRQVLLPSSLIFIHFTDDWWNTDVVQD